MPQDTNPSLDALVDIALPEPVAWWPPAAGWWWLLGAVLVAVLAAGWALTRQWFRNRYRRVAVRKLESLTRLGQSPAAQAAALQDVARLLKRVALVSYRRQRVAGLSGDAWLAFLQQTAPAAMLTGEPAERLATATSDLNREPLAREGWAALMDNVRRWIVQHAEVPHVDP